jgi:hypothetical protein
VAFEVGMAVDARAAEVKGGGAGGGGAGCVVNADVGRT